MKILYRVGDIMQTQLKYIVHGCNQQGRMKSGLAKTIRSQYPEAYREYYKIYVGQGLGLGQIIPVNCGRHTIVNAITQQYYGRDKSTVYVSYEAIELVMLNLNKYLDDQLVEVALPLIGAGLANGSWKTISSIIEQTSSFQPVVYKLIESETDDH